MRMIFATMAALLLFASVLGVSVVVNHYAEAGYAHIHNMISEEK